MPFPAFFLLAAALGTREGIIKRRDKKDVLSKEAERLEAVGELSSGFVDPNAISEADISQIQVLNERFTQGRGLLESKDPKLQAMGANMLAQTRAAFDRFRQQNENETLAAKIRQQDQEIAAAGIGRGANEKRFERELTMNRQVNDELKSLQDAQVSYDKVMNLLDNNDQLASLAGLTAFVQAIDNSVVREGELIKYQGANGFITQIVNSVNKMEGRDFDPVTKQSVRNAVSALLNSEKARAIAINNSFQDRAVAFGLSPERVMSGIDETLFEPIVIDKVAQEKLEAQADIAEANQEEFVALGAPAEEGGIVNLGEGLAIMGDTLLQLWFDTGRAIRGAKLLVDPETGNIWEQDFQGKLTRVPGTPEMRRQAELIKIEQGKVRLTPKLQKRIKETGQRPRRTGLPARLQRRAQGAPR